MSLLKSKSVLVKEEKKKPLLNQKSSKLSP